MAIIYSTDGRLSSSDNGASWQPVSQTQAATQDGFPKINFPTVEELLANPTAYGAYFTTVQPDGYSIVSRLQESKRMYGIDEARRNYNYAKADVEKMINRSKEEIYNAMNNGAASDPNSASAKSAKAWLDNANSLINQLSPSIVSGSLPTYEQVTGKPMQDPLGGQSVDSKGNIVGAPTGVTQQTAPINLATGQSGSSSSATLKPLTGAQGGSGGVSVSRTPGIQGDIQTFADGSSINLKTGEILSASNIPVVNGQPTQGQQQAQPQTQSQQSWIDDLYKKYFDRSATPAEAQNWAKENPQALESFLTSEAKRYNYTSNFFKGQTNDNLQKAYADIDSNPNIPPAMKQVAKDIVSQYGGSAQADFQSIMDTFSKVKQSTIDPYYANTVNFLQQGFKSNYDSLQKQRALEQESEQITAKQNIENAQGNLEKSGLTFSGQGVKQLGDKSAYIGTGIEGAVPTANRLMASSSGQRFQDTINTLGQNIESKLGSDVARMIQGYQSSGGLKGSVEEQKNQQLGQTLTSIAQSQAAKNNLNRSINVNL